MNSVYVVAFYNIGNNLADIFSVLRQSRVKIYLAVIFNEPLGVFVIEMFFRNLLLGA